MAQESIYDFTVKDNKGNDTSLALYKGKVMLIVNTATACGFTPQYSELDIDKEGKVIARFEPTATQVDLAPAIEALLK